MTRVGLTIFFVALILRVAWVAVLENQLVWSDEREFVEIARGLALGDGYVSPSFRANPLLPAYLGLIFRIFGEDYFAARLGQCIMGALTCVLLYRIGSLLLGPAAGTVSGLFLAVYPPHVYLAGVFYAAAIATFVCSVTVYLAILAIRARGALVLSGACGVALGTTALAVPVFLAYLPWVIMVVPWATQAPRRRRALAAASVLIGTALTILPWTARNHRVFGRPIPISSGFYTKLWQGNNELALGIAEDRELMWDTAASMGWLGRVSEPEQHAFLDKYREATALLKGNKGGDRYLATDELAKPFVLQYIRENPGRVGLLFLKKLGVLFSAFSSTFSDNPHTVRRVYVLATLSFYPMLVMALLGALVALSRARELALLYSLILSISFSYAALTSCTRFRLPLDPFLITFAATGAVWLWERRILAKATDQKARAIGEVQGVASDIGRSAA